MPSLFYTAAYERRFPLPFLFLEDVEVNVTALEGEVTDKQVMTIISACLARYLPNRKADSKDIAYVSERLEILAKEAAEAAEKDDGKSKKQKKDFATSFSEWVSELTPHDVCLVVSGFDHHRARQLYSEVDRDDVMAMSVLWTRSEWERIKVGYESVVYGFGGSYGDDLPSDNQVDVKAEKMNEGTVISRAALNAVKF